MAAIPASIGVLLCLTAAPAGLTAAEPARAVAPAPFALRDGDRVVFYGDSITQDGGYARLVEEYVSTRFPGWDVSFENAGVGGDTVRGGWAGPIELRLERDVIAFKPTVVTIMLGMNDGGYKPFDPMTLSTFGEGYRAIVDRLRQALPEVRLTLIRSSPFDDVSRKPQFAGGYDDALRRLGCYVTSLPAGPNASQVDFRTPVNAALASMVTANPELAQLLLPDRVHPSVAGHLVMGATLLRAWNAPALVSRVELDARTKAVVAAEKTTVSGLVADGGRLRWTQLDEALPLPLSFDDADVAFAQAVGADLEGLDSQPLFVRGLAAGRYELRIDGEAIGTFADGELARGVNLAVSRTPQRRQAYAVKWSVADSHELQRVRRRLMASAPTASPQTQRTIDALTAVDAAARKTRRESALPKPRQYELVPR
jgi:lysophospholipase L1-like esterase